MNATSCPEYARLVDFSLGRLDERSIEDLSSHLDSCRRCEEVLDRIESGSDTLLRMIRMVTRDDVMRYDDDAWSSLADKAVAIRDLEREEAWAIVLADVELSLSELIDAVDQGKQPRLGQYTLSKRLGQGAMGVVFLARHNHLKKKVAIKLLHFDRIRHPQAIARFQREMEAVGQLHHPNIVHATDAGHDDGLHFLVMEYVVGQNLDELVRCNGQLRISDACEISRQVAMGLGHAHGKGLVHRDIKPSNLLLDASGQVKILDLGIALLTSEVSAAALNDQHEPHVRSEGDGTGITHAGTIVGTRAYMAPEQARNSHNVDQRADIYSLGCTLYFLLAAQHPRRGMGNVGQALASRTNWATRRAITDIRPDIPTDLEAVIDSMLAEQPQDRPANVEIVQTELEAFCHSANLSRLAGKSPAGFPPVAHTDQKGQAIGPFDLSSGDERSPYSVDRDRNWRWALVLAGLFGAMLLFALPVAAVLLYWLRGSSWSHPPAVLVETHSAPEPSFPDLPKPAPPPGSMGNPKSSTAENDLELESHSEISQPKAPSLPEVVQGPPGESDSIDRSDQDRSAVSFNAASRFSKVVRVTGNQSIVVENSRTKVTPSQTFTAELWFRIVGQGRMGRGITLLGNRDLSFPSTGSQLRSEHDLWRLTASSDSAFGGMRLVRGSEFGLPPISSAGATAAMQAGWNHLAICSNGADMFAWINGKQKLVPESGHRMPARNFGPPISFVQGSDLKIGGSDAANPFSYAAVDLMAFRLSDHVRYPETFEPPRNFDVDAQTLSLLNFSEGSGDVLKDETNHRRDGKLLGAKWVDPTTPLNARFGPGR